MEQKKLIFPKMSNKDLNKMLEEVDGDEYGRILYEIEELKNEMTSIVVSQTPSGTKERFGLPKKLAGVGMAETHVIADWKDRYSALIMADYEASETVKPAPQYEHIFHGGTVDRVTTHSIADVNISNIRRKSETGARGNCVSMPF
jgi:hypothetical protein